MFFHPMINDVTTTPEAPPAYVVLAQTAPNKGRDMGYPPGNIPAQRLAYPDLAPLALPEAPEACFARAVAAAKAMPGWALVAEDAAARRIEAVATTRLFRWQDGVVVRRACRQQPRRHAQVPRRLRRPGQHSHPRFPAGARLGAGVSRAPSPRRRRRGRPDELDPRSGR